MDYVITFSDVMAGLMSIGLGVITFFVKKWFDKMEKKDDVLQSAIENTMILSILVDTFISKISFPMQPGPEIGSISDA